MEKVKKNKPGVAANQKPKVSLRDYFKGIKTETKKVIWPTKKELVSYTGVVIFTCAIFGVGIWAVDSAFLAALKVVLNISF
ncbi:preprotein translocase subunit SecE [Anaerovorax odorimutans]|uniref:preprotein translocase subunit SecE n=1 Tax=Anaerovorax odorimutans TaxID=109327 RepID=UPI0003FD4E08|nr:preprotein translocase subunit SecE [Anaerovorax odorimutans]